MEMGEVDGENDFSAIMKAHVSGGRKDNGLWHAINFKPQTITFALYRHILNHCWKGSQVHRG